MKKTAMFPTFLWLFLYLLLSTILGNLAQTDRQVYLIGAVPQLLLALICLFYLLRSGLAQKIGLTGRATESPSTMLYYLPLFLVVILSLFYGLRIDLNALDYLAIFGMFAAVGFMEEVIFRGMMFTALSEKWNHGVVILFISFTFAMGHILSIVAVGMTGWETFLQIINAFVVGFLFMLVMVTSRNLRVCILAHILYNFFATISLVNATSTEKIVVTAVITLGYAFYLWNRSAEMHKYLEQEPRSVKS